MLIDDLLALLLRQGPLTSVQTRRLLLLEAPQVAGEEPLIACLAGGDLRGQSLEHRRHGIFQPLPQHDSNRR
jgi:hypothetical protein